MKNRKLLVALSLVLCLAMTAGGTLAYLTDTDEAVNVMTLGDVDIVQFERERTSVEPTQNMNDGTVVYQFKQFTQKQALFPAVIKQEGIQLDHIQWYRGDDYWTGDYNDVSAANPEKEFDSAWAISNNKGGVETYADTYFHLVDRASINGYIDKVVSVTNAGDSAAYVRTLIAIPSGGWTFEKFIGDNSWLHFDYVADSVDLPYPDRPELYGSGKNTYWHWDNDQEASDNGKAAQVSEWDVVTGKTGEEFGQGTGVAINGINYFIFVATHAHELPEPPVAGQTGHFAYGTAKSATGYRTAPNLLGFYMDPAVGKDDTGWYYKNTDGTETTIENFANEDGNMEILVMSQAVQTANFDGMSAWEALDAAFGDITDTNHPWYDAPSDGE